MLRLVCVCAECVARVALRTAEAADLALPSFMRRPPPATPSRTSASVTPSCAILASSRMLGGAGAVPLAPPLLLLCARTPPLPLPLPAAADAAARPAAGRADGSGANRNELLRAIRTPFIAAGHSIGVSAAARDQEEKWGARGGAVLWWCCLLLT